MGEYWKTSEEAIDILKRLHEKLGAHEGWLKQFKTTDCVVVYKYSNPDVNWWMDTRTAIHGDGWAYGAGPEPDEFEVRLQMEGDVAHKAWYNKLNFLMGITRQYIIIERRASKLLKLAPLQRLTGEIYEQTLREMGKQDLLLTDLL